MQRKRVCYCCSGHNLLSDLPCGSELEHAAAAAAAASTSCDAACSSHPINVAAAWQCITCIADVSRCTAVAQLRGWSATDIKATAITAITASSSSSNSCQFASTSSNLYTFLVGRTQTA